LSVLDYDFESKKEKYAALMDAYFPR